MKSSRPTKSGKNRVDRSLRKNGIARSMNVQTTPTRYTRKSLTQGLRRRQRLKPQDEVPR
ncbi:MAG: hypothetical protein J5U17_08850 [Candidatus Methanoperedens sp.]|nr:hypothetical protein [Candidatus Methanoperedens sp.]